MAGPLVAPPTLSEPLVALKTSSWQSFIGWVHGAIRSLASGLQAEQHLREAEIQELRADARGMLERIHRLEARDGGSSERAEEPAPDLAQDVRQLEAKLASWREQSSLKQGTEEDLLRLRLDALESDVRASLQPKDLEAERLALQELRQNCEAALREEGRAQHAALQSKLAETGEQLREALQVHSSSFDERLRMCESRLTAAFTPIQTPPQAASEVSEPKEESRRPGSTGSGAGAAGGASLESRVARLERNIKVMGGGPAALASPLATDGRRLEEVATHSMRVQQDVQRLMQRSQAMESRLSALDGLAASMAAGGGDASAAAVEALERRLEQHLDEKLSPLREQLSLLDAPEKITAEEKMDKGLLEQVHKDLLFAPSSTRHSEAQGSPASPSAQEEAPDPLALINATIASRGAEAQSAPSSPKRDSTSSQVSALHTKLQAHAAQQDDRALRLEQEMKLLQQKFFENAAVQATAGSGGSAGNEAASALATTLSHHDEELKNLAASVQGLQATVARTAPAGEASAAPAASATSSSVTSATAAADADVKALQARLDSLQRRFEAQPVPAAASPGTNDDTGPIQPIPAGEGASDPRAQVSTADSDARAGEALQRATEAEKRVLQLAEEVSSFAERLERLRKSQEDILKSLKAEDAAGKGPAVAEDSSASPAAAEDVTQSHAETEQVLPPSAGSPDRDQAVSPGEAPAPALQAELQALAAQQDDRAQRMEQEMKLLEQEMKSLQQKFFENVAAQVTAGSGGPAGNEAASALATTLSHHDEELKNLAVSVKGLQAAISARSVPATEAAAAPANLPSSVATPATAAADDNVNELQASAAPGAVADAAGQQPVAEVSRDLPPQASTAAIEARAGEALQRVAEAERRILELAGEVESGQQLQQEVERVSASLTDLREKVESGQQLQLEVERVSASLTELRVRVEDDSLRQEVLSLKGALEASLERPKSSAALKQEVSKFAESLENLRFRQDDFLVQLKAAKATLNELPALKEELRSGREATDSLAQSFAKMKEATSTELHQLTNRFNQLEEKRLKQLGMDVQALQGALVHVQTELQKEVVIPDHILREIDAKSEARQEAMWAELHKHAETAAHRADQLERSLSSRLVSLEHSTNALLQNEAHSREMEREMAKQSEWFAWRIAWLEWATTGEKRSFARPLLPPPATPAATCFKQPMTEDSELWAQEKTGRQRLRRAPLLRLPSAGPANAQRLLQTDASPASAKTLATSSSAPDLVVGPASAGETGLRLPQVG